MIIGVLKEPFPETRVSLLPEHIAALRKSGTEVLVEQGAGTTAFATDEDYRAAGANVVVRAETIAGAELLLSINEPSPDEQPQLRSKLLIGVYQPLTNTAFVERSVAAGSTIISLDLLPRTTRAQAMDALSSQANIAGYKAVLTAANMFPKYFPMFMTAAGTIPPAKMLVLGAGVAGLQAIATGRRLGAVVEVFDTRPSVKEEVMSLGGKFIEVEGAADASNSGGYAVEQSAEFMERQKARIAAAVAKSDIIITTAQIPARKAPLLVSKAMVESMKNGSVIVDLAAATGGNTELTKDEATIVHHGVTIVGNSRLAASMPSDASKLYGKNILNFLQLLTGKDGTLQLNFADDLVKGACIVHAGEVLHERVRLRVSSADNLQAAEK